MKIKKFKNIWTMGLVLSFVMFGILILIKSIFPNFVIEVAQIDSVVAFGNYIDSHMWAYYLYDGIISFITYYVYCCACCRTKKLDAKKCILIIAFILVGNLIYEFLPVLSLTISYIYLLLLPTLFIAMDKKQDIKYLYSTATCFVIHAVSQILIKKIRGIDSAITYPNSATFTLLIIDGFILLFCLYFLYNKKGGEQ